MKLEVIYSQMFPSLYEMFILHINQLTLGNKNKTTESRCKVLKFIKKLNIPKCKFLIILLAYFCVRMNQLKLEQ